MTVKIYNTEGAEVGKVKLDEALFGIEPNESVVHQYITNYRARQRQGNSASRTRNAIRGGGRKPWRQKGTGRARAGTIRSPLWRGGGIVHGPIPRDFGSVFPKKMRRLAIKSIFSAKAKSDKIKVVDKIDMAETKTRLIAGIMTRLDLAGKKCLILDEGRNDKLALSCRNLEGVTYGRAAIANGYQVMSADIVLFTKAGLEKVEEVFA